MPDSQLIQQFFEELKSQRQQVLEALKEMADRLSRVETVLIPAPGQPTVLQEHDARIQSLERAESRAKGVLWAAGGLWTALWAAWEYVFHHH